MTYSYKHLFSEENNMIHIVEANAGYQDHPDFKRVLGELMNLIKSELTHLSNHKLSNFNDDIMFVINYTLNTVRYREVISKPITAIKQKLTIVFRNETKSPSQENELFTDGGSYFGDEQFVIKIGVNKEKHIQDLLNNINEVEWILTHELTHIFQNLYDNYKKTQAYYEKAKDKSGDTFGKWYWTNKLEIEAYTTQINTQLRQIRKENPTITFKSAMLNIRAWKDLNEFIPEDYKHLLKRILHKTVHYWTHNMGGKINEVNRRVK